MDGVRARKPLVLERRTVDLTLARPWTIARGSSTVKTNVLVRVSAGDAGGGPAASDGTGLGEAAPNARYGEDWRSVLGALDRMAPLVDDDPERLSDVVARLHAAAPADHAARAAADIALHDLAGRRAGR